MPEPRALSTEFTSPVILLRMSALGASVLVGIFKTLKGVIIASASTMKSRSGAGDATARPLSALRARYKVVLESVILVLGLRELSRVVWGEVWVY
jgi:hypothetical protein